MLVQKQKHGHRGRQSKNHGGNKVFVEVNHNRNYVNLRFAILNNEIFSSERNLDNELADNTENQGVESSYEIRAKNNSVVVKKRNKLLGESSKGN